MSFLIIDDIDINNPDKDLLIEDNEKLCRGWIDACGAACEYKQALEAACGQLSIMFSERGAMSSQEWSNYFLEKVRAKGKGKCK